MLFRRTGTFHISETVFYGRLAFMLSLQIPDLTMTVTVLLHTSIDIEDDSQPRQRFSSGLHLRPEDSHKVALETRRGILS